MLNLVPQYAILSAQSRAMGSYSGKRVGVGGKSRVVDGSGRKVGLPWLLFELKL